jgi:hypothetical protein
VVATLVITILGDLTLSGGAGVNGSAHSAYILGVFANLGWIGFLCLFLGWLAAMGGAISGLSTLKHHPAQPNEAENLRQMRPAA